MHSLGFKTSQDKSGPAQSCQQASASQQKSAVAETNQQQQTSQQAEKLVLSESDKLNGNNQGPEPPKPPAGASSSSREDGAQPVRKRIKPVCAAAKQPAARASMGAIIKGRFDIYYVIYYHSLVC